MKFYQVKDLKYAKEIYNLNNSSFVRKHSENSKHFSYKNHLSWMNKLIKSKNNRAFVYISKKNLIGFIKSEKIKKKFFLSWSISKKFRNKGYGKKMLNYVCVNSKRKYHAKIMTKNINSLKMCLSCDFKIYFRNNNFYFLKN